MPSLQTGTFFFFTPTRETKRDVLLRPYFFLLKKRVSLHSNISFCF
jgi:hypothetical protein